jgi:septal ring factor EnvC (AmiA/AmiB activator)
VWRSKADRLHSALGLAISALLLLPPAEAAAQDRKDLEQIERQIEVKRKQRQSLDQERAALDKGVSALRRNLIRAARTAQEHESVLTRLEAKLPELEAEAAQRVAALGQRRKQMTGTLAALERLSRNPPQALLLSKAEPLKIVRNAILLRSAVPQLRKRAAALRADLDDIAGIRRELEDRQRAIHIANRSLETERNRLNALMVHKTAERRRMAEETRLVEDRLEALNRRAKSLRELFSNLERQKAQRSIRTPSAPRPEARPSPGTTDRLADTVAINPNVGAMTPPARGRLVERFGDDTGTGGTSKGATFVTRPRAQVVAPYDGKVVFAGPFKGYGQILIIQHGDAYHTLLAGMRRVDATLGQRLLAGEPIGVMGIQDAGSRLYIEVRRKGQPINPLPWFTAANSKVRG